MPAENDLTRRLEWKSNPKTALKNIFRLIWLNQVYWLANNKRKNQTICELSYPSFKDSYKPLLVKYCIKKI